MPIQIPLKSQVHHNRQADRAGSALEYSWDIILTGLSIGKSIPAS